MYVCIYKHITHAIKKRGNIRDRLKQALTKKRKVIKDRRARRTGKKDLT